MLAEPALGPEERFVCPLSNTAGGLPALKSMPACTPKYQILASLPWADKIIGVRISRRIK
jgi:hypothetical protein